MYDFARAWNTFGPGAKNNEKMPSVHREVGKVGKQNGLVVKIAKHYKAKFSLIFTSQPLSGLLRFFHTSSNCLVEFTYLTNQPVNRREFDAIFPSLNVFFAQVKDLARTVE